MRMVGVRRADFLGRKCLRGFLKSRSGATAVEFGMVALPFFTLLLSVLEMGTIFFKAEYLQSGVEEAGRRVMTGQVQANASPEDFFKTTLCDQVQMMISCSDIRYDVKSYETFAGADTSVPMKDGNLDASKLGFAPGGGGKITVVKAYVEIPVFVSYFGSTLANQANGTRLLIAGAAFKNEPF